jgi:O-antigen/teichoic acid export membrane protein
MTFNTFIEKIIDTSLLRDSISSSVMMVLGVGFGFLLQLTLARTLGVETFGIYIYVITWITSLSFVGKLGFDVAAIKFTSAYVQQGDRARLAGFVKASSWIVTVCSFVFSIVLCISLVIFFPRDEQSNELLNSFFSAVPLLLLFCLMQTFGGTLRGLGKVFIALCPQTVFYPALLIVSLFVINLLGTHALTSQTVFFLNEAIAFIVVFLQWWCIRKIIADRHSSNVIFEVKEWVSVSLPMALTSGAQTLYRVIDILMVGMIMGPTQAGIYAVASRVSRLTSFGLQAVNFVIAPSFSTLYSQGDKAGLQQKSTRAAWLSLISATTIIIILLLFADLILELFGENFIAGLTVLNILLVGEFINSLSGSNGILMNMTNMQKEQAFITHISMGLAVIFIPIFIHMWDTIGAAIASVIIVSFRNLTILFKLWKTAGINPTVFPYHTWLPIKEK